MKSVPAWRSTRLKLWLAPKVWFQGSQSSSTSGASSRNGQIWASCCWFAVSMPWVLMTPLGRLVEPEVNRNLAMVSAGTALRHLIEGGDALHVGAVTARHDLRLQVERGERFGERAGVRDIDQAGRDQGGDVFELGMVLAL